MTSCVTNSADQFLKVASKEKVYLTYEDKREEGYINFLNKLNVFQANLSEELYLEFGTKYDNICVSPASIYMALALAVECSDLNTRLELLNALGMTYEDVRTYTKKLYSVLNNEYKTTTPFGQEKIKALELLTNSIWFEESIELKEVGLNN